MQSVKPTIRFYIEQNDVFMLCGAVIDEEFKISQSYKYEPAQGWLIVPEPEELDDSFLADEETVAKVILVIEKSYKEQLQLAMDVAQACHKGQKDRSGVDYFEGHLTYVANRVPEGKAKIVAYLHDVIEDTEMKPDILLNMGFGYECVDAILAMSHDSAEDYMDYIKEVKKNPLAKQVKLADLAHNMDLTRLKKIGERDIQRADKYRQAYVELLK